MPTPSSCTCNCPGNPAVDLPRRRVIGIAAAGLAAPLVRAAAPSLPQAGDLLVEEDAEGAPTPLRVTDLAIGKPLLAFPWDKAGARPRDGTRLNKIVLMRFAEADLNAASRQRAAGGVLAFSAICTHQGCDVKTWLSKEKQLVCFCHSSKFALLDGGSVTSGPANRPLPAIPLALDGDRLVIAGAFTAPPGGQPA
jgi:rieske iron-sulfur protein